MRGNKGVSEMTESLGWKDVRCDSRQHFAEDLFRVRECWKCGAPLTKGEDTLCHGIHRYVWDEGKQQWVPRVQQEVKL
jgi:5-methylcytosine-specific restriction endonuclease McrA